MGQRFSYFRETFVTMDESKVVKGSKNMNDDDSDSSVDAVETLDKSASQRCSGANGNESENVHFESIYSGEQLAQEISSDELNGNLPPPKTCESCCCCQKSCKSVLNDNAASNQSHSKKQSRTKSSRPKGHRKDSLGNLMKKRSHWVLTFNCSKLKTNVSESSSSSVDSDLEEACVCTAYKRTDGHTLTPGIVGESSTYRDEDSSLQQESSNPVIDLARFRPQDFPIDDCDERARQERAREIAEGVEPPPGFTPGQHIQLVYPPELTIDNLTLLFQAAQLGLPATLNALSKLDICVPPFIQRVVHTQVDYIHCLVPDLLEITSCSFYWGKMDRYEAERWLESRPEGTFLLRDSAQEEYLFSVSFRKYGRSLHARIEQWNHLFSFDSHDPGVYASPTVCGLIEHYKDPTCCMFFEPMLTIPLHRNFPFPLQHLCRATICNRLDYDSINKLCLPKAMKSYLKEYHYKQRVRVRRFDNELPY